MSVNPIFTNGNSARFTAGTDFHMPPGKLSAIIATQVPIETWIEHSGDPTLADAILDRLVHNAHKINLF